MAGNKARGAVRRRAAKPGPNDGGDLVASESADGDADGFGQCRHQNDRCDHLANPCRPGKVAPAADDDDDAQNDVEGDRRPGEHESGDGKSKGPSRQGRGHGVTRNVEVAMPKRSSAGTPGSRARA